MLRYLSTEDSKVSSAGLQRINYLIGEFNVQIYLYQSGFWTKTGVGVASISGSEKLVTEKIEIMRGNDMMSMNNTFGHETDDNYKMLTLDLTSGTMDVYRGKMHDEKLIFCNTQNTISANDHDEQDYTFKLIYNQLSEIQNQVVIGRSKDQGKTWIPYLKSVYKRK